jgi:hypothetical protein
MLHKHIKEKEMERSSVWEVLSKGLKEMICYDISFSCVESVV